MAIAQLVEPRIVIPVVVGSNPISHPIFVLVQFSKVTELVDALVLNASIYYLQID